MRIVKKILIILLIALIVIQFFRPEKNIAAQSPNDISTLYAVPADAKQILDKACNDCHSNNTKYPWYAEIQPVAWWLADHVKEGKAELNFNEFASYRLRKQYHKMEEIVEMVKEGEMPLDSYTWVHKDAKLTTEEKRKISAWADDIRKQMEAKYPMDSLVRKK